MSSGKMHQQTNREFSMFTYYTRINAVKILTINPTNVIKLGASHIGVFETSQHHHGFNMGSNRLQLVIEYLCSVSRFSWAGTSSLFLYENILFNFTIITNFTRFECSTICYRFYYIFYFYTCLCTTSGWTNEGTN